jgi:hypothetical protein
VPVLLIGIGVAVSLTYPADAADTATKHPVAVRTTPVQVKPLIPPATPAVKLGPPPDPHPPLSLETVLQPVAPGPQTAPSDSPTPAAGKTPTS